MANKLRWRRNLPLLHEKRRKNKQRERDCWFNVHAGSQVKGQDNARPTRNTVLFISHSILYGESTMHRPVKCVCLLETPEFFSIFAKNLKTTPKHALKPSERIAIRIYRYIPVFRYGSIYFDIYQNIHRLMFNIKIQSCVPIFRYMFIIMRIFTFEKPYQ